MCSAISRSYFIKTLLLLFTAAGLSAGSYEYRNCLDKPVQGGRNIMLEGFSIALLSTSEPLIGSTEHSNIDLFPAAMINGMVISNSSTSRKVILPSGPVKDLAVIESEGYLHFFLVSDFEDLVIIFCLDPSLDFIYRNTFQNPQISFAPGTMSSLQTAGADTWFIYPDSFFTDLLKYGSNRGPLYYKYYRISGSNFSWDPQRSLAASPEAILELPVYDIKLDDVKDENIQTVIMGRLILLRSYLVSRQYFDMEIDRDSVMNEIRRLRSHNTKPELNNMLSLVNILRQTRKWLLQSRIKFH